MAKQPIKSDSGSDTVTKKPAVKKGQFDLKSFKETNNLSGVKEKDLEWFTLSPAFQEITRVPGIPKGYFTMVTGYQNTGKSTMKLELMKSCQQNGVLPVIIETENNFSWDHAKMIGVEFEDVYGDVVNEDTGEIEQKVVDHEGFFIYYDSDILFKKYGKWDYSNSKELSKPNRDIACVEDIAHAINDLLKMQLEGDLPHELCFIWDSVGTTDCYRSLMSPTGNNMFNAGAISTAFSSIINDKIPSSRKETRLYTNTFFCVNKIWKNSMGMGATTVETKGGNSMNYAVRLKIHLGGIESPGVKKLKATKGGKDFYYGVETKIRVEKNHVNNLTYEGTICSTPHGYVNPTKLDDYKKEQVKYLLKQLDAEGSDISDLKFSATEED